MLPFWTQFPGHWPGTGVVGVGISVDSTKNIMCLWSDLLRQRKEINRIHSKISLLTHMQAFYRRRKDIRLCRKDHSILQYNWKILFLHIPRSLWTVLQVSSLGNPRQFHQPIQNQCLKWQYDFFCQNSFKKKLYNVSISKR